MTTTDRGGPARYAQIVADLRSQILTGKLAVGDRVPGDIQIRDEYHVSKTTAVRALSVLAEEGLVERRVGIGTFVAHRPEVLLVDVGPGTRITATGTGTVITVERPGAPVQRYRAETTVIRVTGERDLPLGAAEPIASL